MQLRACDSSTTVTMTTISTISTDSTIATIIIAFICGIAISVLCQVRCRGSGIASGDRGWRREINPGSVNRAPQDVQLLYVHSYRQPTPPHPRPRPYKQFPQEPSYQERLLISALGGGGVFRGCQPINCTSTPMSTTVLRGSLTWTLKP